jgi:capsular polysaccharide export protein
MIPLHTSSNAAHASRNSVLVIKHHPMDRAYHDYTVLIRELVAQYSLQNRCFYIHDQHLPSLLKNTCGVVVVNSTVALSALFHKAPVKVCGKAIYNMAGLTFQGPLALFWRQAHASRPNQLLYQSFVAHLIEHTQLNGSFYKRLPIPMLATGLSWKDRSAPAKIIRHSQSGRQQLSLVTKDVS